MTAASYRAHGLVIRSTLALGAPRARAGTPADVVVRRGPVADPPEASRGSGVTAWVTAAGVHLSCAGAGRFLVRHGAEIVVDPAAGVPDGVLRLYLLGPVLAALLRQRGWLVLHASAVSIGREAIAFLGGPGRGKSTTAGALRARGHRLLADDITAVMEANESHHVVPGVPRLRLWPDASRALGADPQRLPRVYPGLDKRELAVPTGGLPESAPLGCIYTLDVGDDAGIEALGPQAALVELLRHTYGGRSLQAVGPAEHFLRCARLARAVPVRRLGVRRSLSALADTARLVEDDGRHAPV